MARVILFDVNETLLDASVLDPFFRERFGDARVRKEWFKQTLQSALVATLTNTYVDFDALERAAFEMTAAAHGVSVTDEDKQALASTARKLPPYPDVREGLSLLRDGGLRLAALTNSPTEVLEAQLKNAALHDLFEQALSIDTVRRFKPHGDAYSMAAVRLGVEKRELRVVTAHAWDVAGALRAGCTAAFVSRPGKALDPLVPRPDVIGEDLRAVCRKIIDVEVAGS